MNILAKECYLPEEKVVKYAKLYLWVSLKVMSLIFVGMLVFFAFLLNEEIFFIFYALIALFVGILFIISVILYLQSLSYIPLHRWVLEEEFIEQFMDRSQMSSFHKFRHEVGEAKSGASFNQIIYFDQINSISEDKNFLIIKSKQFNFLNNNGRILIPKDIVHYAEIVKGLKECVPVSLWKK